MKEPLRSATQGARLWLTVLCWTVIAAGSLRAQRYSLRRYDELRGLPSPMVHDVLQDGDGCLWVACRSVVVRYDGHDWDRLLTKPGGFGEASSLHLGSDDRVWLVGTVGTGRLSVWNGREWYHRPVPATRERGAVVHAALTTLDGQDLLLLARRLHGVDLFGTQGWTDPGLKLRAQHVAPSRDGFLISHDQGLSRFDPRTGSLESVPGLPEGPVMGALEEPGGPTWVLGTGWLGRLDTGTFTSLHDAINMMPGYWPAVLSHDGFGGLFFGSHQVLFHHDAGGTLVRLGQRGGRTAESATGLCLDRERNLWVATPRGMNKLTSLRFQSMDSRLGLYDDEVTATLRRRSGAMVVGHNGALTFLDGEARHHVLDGDPRRVRVMDLAEDPAGTVWVAASAAGLLRVTSAGDVVHHPGIQEHLKGVVALHVDADGVVWVGGDLGFGRLRDGVFEPHPSVASQRALFVRGITSRGDRLFLATLAHGALELIDGALVPLEDPVRSTTNNTYSVLCREDGSIWIGRGDGLRVLGTRGPLPAELADLDRPVYFVAESPTGQVWLGSDDGVRRWHQGKLDHFGVHEGLLGAEANRHAVAFHEDGRAWFGTDQGLNLFLPWYDAPRPHGPTVEVIAARADQDLIDLTGPVSLEVGRDSLTFKLRAISFADERQVRFQTRLEGLEDQFTDPALIPDRTVRYPHLPPGTYRLHVRAISVEGLASEISSSPPITIQPRLLRRLWFQVLLGAAILSAFLLLGMSLMQRRHAGRLERAVQSRTADLEASRAATAAEGHRLAAVLASIHDAVVVIDRADRVVLWNQAAVEIFGVEACDAVGHDLEKLLGQRLPESGDFEVHAGDGGNRCLELSRAAIPSGVPGAGGTVLAVRDVTDRLRVDAERSKAQQLHSLGILAGGIAHDFNNLLMVVIGNLGQVMVAPGKNQLLDDAVAAAEQAAALTRQLLTFSRGGAPVRDTTSIAELVQESTRFVLHGSSTRAEFHLPEDLWPVEVDAGQIGQVIQNLLLNAREAMPDGGCVRVSAENLASAPAPLPDGCYVAIHVQDEGPGIEPDHLQRVFDPYFSTKERGSGLGLTTAYSIVERHEGRLSIRSSAGAGTTFSVYLPAGVEGVVEESTGQSPGTPRPGRILVLDDEDAIRRVVQSMLEHAGHEVVTVADGSEALQKYREAHQAGAPFDVVLMDLTIPGGAGGKETIHGLRDIDPQVRAIVASGYSDDPVLAEPDVHGFCAALTKPFTRGALLEAVARAQGRDREVTESQV